MLDVSHPFLRAITVRLVRVSLLDHDDQARGIARKMLDVLVQGGVLDVKYVENLKRELTEVVVALANGEEIWR